MGWRRCALAASPKVPPTSEVRSGSSGCRLSASAFAATGRVTPRVRDLMIALGIERATIVGQSLGGGVAMLLAYQHSQRCERLVLVSSGGLGSEVSWMLRALTLPGVEYLMPVLFPSFVRDAGTPSAGAWSASGCERRISSRSGVPTSRSPIPAAAGPSSAPSGPSCPDGQTVSAQDKLYLASGLPTLILWGRRDRIIPVGHGLRAHDAIPVSRLVIFEESGHFPHTEEPEHFVEVLEEFIDGTQGLELDEPAWRAILTAGPPS